MATDKNQIVVELILDDGQILKALGKVKQEASNTKKSLEDEKGGGFFSKKISDITVGTVALGVAAKKAFDLVANGLSNAVDESRKAQKAIDDLSSALAINGNFSEQAVSKFTGFVDELSRATGIEDDLIIQNASLLASLGKLSGDGLERATKAAIDLSAATGKDLGTTFNLLAKAANGSTEQFGRLGIKIDENIPKAEKLGAVLNLLEQRFGGLAASRGDTFEGTLNKLSNAYGNLFEVLGDIVTKSPAFKAALQVVTELLIEFTDKLQKATQGKDIFGNILKSLTQVGLFINTYLIRPFEIFLNIAGAAGQYFVVFGAGALRVIYSISYAFINFITLPIVDFFGSTLGKIVGIASKQIGDTLTNSVKGATDKVRGLLTSAGEFTSTFLDSSLSVARDKLTSQFTSGFADGLDSFITKIQTAMETATTATAQFSNNATNSLEGVKTKALELSEAFTAVSAGFMEEAGKLSASATDNFKKVGAAMLQGLGNAAGQAFAAFGKAAAKGENAMQAFIDSLVASFGQMAIQLGTQFILTGIAYSFAGLPNGPALIAAGAALATFGGVLSALGGGQSSVGTGDTSSVTTGGSGAITTDLDQPELEPQTPQSLITLNINGDVLDSDETGGRIVKLLSDYADKNGNGAVVV